jgi:SAM-dependent methyltransferase
MTTEAKVSDHYGSGDLTKRILAALAETGQPTDRISADALFPFDQLHGRQLAATKEHVGRLKLDPGKTVLDVGSGIGGPARYMAFSFGCRVSGIDVTEAFVTTARELTARCGLSDRVDFRVGNALAMPFADASFDAAACQYVAMNIADKAGLLREIHRVLKPGGQLVWSSVVAGPGEPRYPLPWARDPSVSFLVSPRALRALFDAAGFRILEWSDESDLLRAASASPPPPAFRAMSGVILGEDFGERFQNFGRNIEAGSIGSVLALAERV